MFNDHSTLITIKADPGPGTGITVVNKTLPDPQRNLQSNGIMSGTQRMGNLNFVSWQYSF